MRFKNIFTRTEILPAPKFADVYQGSNNLRKRMGLQDRVEGEFVNGELDGFHDSIVGILGNYNNANIARPYLGDCGLLHLEIYDSDSEGNHTLLDEQHLIPVSDDNVDFTVYVL